LAGVPLGLAIVGGIGHCNRRYAAMTTEAVDITETIALLNVWGGPLAHVTAMNDPELEQFVRSLCSGIESAAALRNMHTAFEDLSRRSSAMAELFPEANRRIHGAACNITGVEL
jgi:hypothetical protein